MILTRLQLLVVVVVLSAARAYIDLVSVEQEYIAYLRTFGKNLDRLTDSRRIERFIHQLQIIHEHNARKTANGKAGPSFSLQLNAMSDMLPEEVNQLFGYRNNKKNVAREHGQTSKKALRKKKQDSEGDESYYHSNLYPFFNKKKKKGKAKEALWKNVAVPESINWSNNDNPIGSSVMSSVRNQGTCGACWAFVAVATAEAALRISLSGSSSTTQETLTMPGATEQTHVVRTTGFTMRQSTPEGLNGRDGDISASGDSNRSRGSSTGEHQMGMNNNGKATLNLRDSNRISSTSTIIDTTPHRNASSNSFYSTPDPFPFSSLFDPPFPHNYRSQDLPSSPRLAWIPSLSVQQLVDCDTTFNRGCSGGSPLYAFRFIASKGLVPWSRYEYEEKVDTCNVKRATMLPVAKYFIRDYGKVSMLDSNALMAAVSKGPVALGVCGTDPHFMLYSTGVFDLDTCCADQNHAITLVGYGYDEGTGLDYWLAQNSWGKLWGESGYIKIKRTDAVGQQGICGMLMNPMYGTGGYILDEKGHFIDPTTSPHYPGYITEMAHWMEDNWREMMVLLSGWLLCISLMILLYACYVERLMYLHAQLRASGNGYTTIDEEGML